MHEALGLTKRLTICDHSCQVLVSIVYFRDSRFVPLICWESKIIFLARLKICSRNRSLKHFKISMWARVLLSQGTNFVVRQIGLVNDLWF